MRIGVAVFVTWVMAMGSASAQTAQPLTVTWQDGFVLESENGDYRLQLGALVQVDGRFSLDDPPQIIDTFTIRKARPIIGARLAKYFDVRLMPDFGNGTATLVDAYFDTRFSSALRVRAGKDKTPVGYESLISDASVLFPERSLVSTLVPLRDVGFQAQGDLAGQKLSYAAGVFNGVPDGTSSTTDVDGNSGKDLAGRVIVRAPGGFGAHLGGSAGHEKGSLPAFKTSIGQTWFSYASGSTADGLHTRIAPAAFFYRKAFGGFGEYVRSTQTVTRGATTRDVANDGWDATLSYVLTGDAASDRGVRPGKPFDPSAHHWGAVQILARRSHLNVDQVAFDSGLASPDASRRAHQTSVGVNWYPTSFVKWYAAYEHIEFHAATTSRPPENSFIVRAQLAF
jgi:phosphate-selective porin OprO/OprP